MNERVGTAHRTQVLDLLGQAFEEGYLDAAEFEHRVLTATSAKTAGELAAQVSDLPAQFRWSPQRQQPAPDVTRPPAATNTHVTSTTSLVLAIISVPMALCFGVGALFGIAALILSRPGLRAGTNYGKSLTGLVVGSVGILFSLAFLLLYFLMPPD
jgi:hypothetical protein